MINAMMVTAGMRNHAQAYFLLTLFKADMPICMAEDASVGICQLDATKAPGVSDALISKMPCNALMGFMPPVSGGILGIDGACGGTDAAAGCCGGTGCA